MPNRKWLPVYSSNSLTLYSSSRTRFSSLAISSTTGRSRSSIIFSILCISFSSSVCFTSTQREVGPLMRHILRDRWTERKVG